MTVLRSVANIAADKVPEVRKFYAALFGLEPVMDLGWVVTLASREPAAPQVGVLSEGGSGAPVPDLSIELDDVDAVHRRAQAMGCRVVHALAPSIAGGQPFEHRPSHESQTDPNWAQMASMYMT